MNDYFSRLSQRTGVIIEPGTAVGADTKSEHARDERNDKAPTEPLHIDTITFNASPPADVRPPDDEVADGAMSDEDVRDAPTVEHLRLNEPTKEPKSGTAGLPSIPDNPLDANSRAEFRIRFPDSDEISSAAMGQPRVDFIASEPFNVEPPPGPRNRSNNFGSSADERNKDHARFEDTGPLPGIDQLPAAINQVQQESSTNRRDQEGLDERTRREEIVRDYLRQVRAWVADTPEKVERGIELDPHLTIDITGVKEPEARPAQPNAIEEHDLNLSIGSISIVIEDPERAAAPAVVAPRADIPVEGRSSEPSRLSRFYLRSW